MLEGIKAGADLVCRHYRRAGVTRRDGVDRLQGRQADIQNMALVIANAEWG